MDQMSWDDLSDVNYDWPTVGDVKTYRDTVRGIVDSLIRTLPLTLPIQWESPWWYVVTGVAFRMMPF